MSVQTGDTVYTLHEDNGDYEVSERLLGLFATEKQARGAAAGFWNQDPARMNNTMSIGTETVGVPSANTQLFSGTAEGAEQAGWYTRPEIVQVFRMEVRSIGMWTNPIRAFDDDRHDDGGAESISACCAVAADWASQLSGFPPALCETIRNPDSWRIVGWGYLHRRREDNTYTQVRDAPSMWQFTHDTWLFRIDRTEEFRTP